MAQLRRCGGEFGDHVRDSLWRLVETRRFYALGALAWFHLADLCFSQAHDHKR
jgi:hypothetical protein